MPSIPYRNYELYVDGELFIGRMEKPDKQLRIDFDVKVVANGNLSTASIGLWNLAMSSSPDKSQMGNNGKYTGAVGVAIKPGAVIRLIAGNSLFTRELSATGGVIESVKHNMGIIFEGTVVNVMRERNGPNIVTRLLSNSGVTKLDKGNISTSLGSVTLADTLKAICTAWNKPLNFASALSDFEAIKMNSGYVMSGDCLNEMQQLSQAFGFVLAVTFSGVTVSFPDKARTNTDVIDVSMATGMVGMPQVEQITGIQCNVDILLNPTVSPSSVFEVTSDFQTFNTGTGSSFVYSSAHAQGRWNLLEYRHRGDNYSAATWITSLTGIREGSIETNKNGGDIGNTKTLTYGRTLDKDERTAARELAQFLGINANWLSAVIQKESSWNPQAKSGTSSAVGLIQFVKATRDSLGYSRAQILAMGRVEQLNGPVKDYFTPYKGRMKNLGDVGMAVFSPLYIGKPDSTIMFSSPSQEYNANRPLDFDNKGYITRGDYTRGLFNIAKKGLIYDLS